MSATSARRAAAAGAPARADPTAGHARALARLPPPGESLRAAAGLFRRPGRGASTRPRSACSRHQGMKVLSARGARKRYARGRRAASTRHSMMVRIDRGLVAQALASAPRALDAARHRPGPQRAVGGRHVAFAPTSGPPNIMDIERGRRAGTFEDFCNLMKLCQSFEVIHVLGGGGRAAGHPGAHPAPRGHARAAAADRQDPVHLLARPPADRRQLRAAAHRARAQRRGVRARAPAPTRSSTPTRRCSSTSRWPRASSTSPPPASRTIITPFTLAGAMAPVTIAGALTLAHAEALAGLVLAQIVRAGAPVVYGSFTSNVDMKSGSPAFGTPEYVKAAFGAGQLARYLGLPWRSSNATASNVPDAQAAYEAQMSLWGALHGRLQLHPARGRLDRERAVHLLREVHPRHRDAADVRRGVPAGGARRAADLALEAVARGRARAGTSSAAPTPWSATARRSTRRWSPTGATTAAGPRTAAATATQRANTIWQHDARELRARPARDPAIVEALEAFVARRKAEGGAPPVS